MAFWDKKGNNDKLQQENSSKYIYRASEELAAQEEDKRKSAANKYARGAATPGSAKHRRAKAKRRSRTTKRRGSAIWRLIPFFFVLLLIAVIAIKIVSYVGGISRTTLTGGEYAHSERFADSLKIEGIDVSEHQGEIKWKKVKSSAADFAFIRAAYRRAETGELVEDATFRTNIKAANKSGIMVGAYIYSQAVNTKEAEEEADFIVKLVKRYDIDLPLVIDYELYPGGRLEQAITNEELFAASHFNDITQAFCRRVEKAGYESAIYANYDMFTNYMDSSLIDKENNLWVAHYGGKCALESDYLFWQASDSAVIDGISGNVDHDFWYIEPGKVYPTRAKGRKKQISVGDCNIEFDKPAYEIKNHRAVPKVTVSSDDKALKEGKHYEIAFIQNIKAGTGYAIIRGIKKYKDWIAVPFTISN